MKLPMIVLLKDRILRHQMQSTHRSPIHQLQDLNPRMVEETPLFPVPPLSYAETRVFTIFVSKWLKLKSA